MVEYIIKKPQVSNNNIIFRHAFVYLKCLFFQVEEIGHGHSLPTTIVYVDRLSTSWIVYFVRVKKSAIQFSSRDFDILKIIKRVFGP